MSPALLTLIHTVLFSLRTRALEGPRPIRPSAVARAPEGPSVLPAGTEPVPEAKTILPLPEAKNRTFFTSLAFSLRKAAHFGRTIRRFTRYSYHSNFIFINFANTITAMKTNHISKYIVACMLAALPFTIFSCNKEDPDQLAGQDKPNQGQTGGKDDPDNGNGDGTPSAIELPEVSFSDTEDLLAYIDEAIDVSFELTGEISETLEVSFTSDGKSAVDGTFDPAAGKGSVSVTLAPEAAHSKSAVSVVLRDGEKEKAFDFEVTAYYLDITASSDNIVFSGESNESKKLEYAVETNIADFTPKVTVNADWLSYADGVLTTTEYNTTGETRTGTVLIADEETRFEGASVSVSQQSLTVDPEGCVRFIDPAFREAMASIADRDGDGFVSYDEALAVTEIVAVGKGIHDLTGLDAFENLWKLDLRDNDIISGDIITHLRKLYWLNLEGNPNMLTADVSGCTNYFEELRIDLDSDIIVTARRNQMIGDSYPHFYNRNDQNEWNKIYDSEWFNLFDKHVKHIDITRRSTDYSQNNTFVQLKEHTQGNGYLQIILTGTGFVDEDIKDGTFDRLMRRIAEYLEDFDSSRYHDNWEHFDVFYMNRIDKSDTEYNFNWDGSPMDLGKERDARRAELYYDILDGLNHISTARDFYGGWGYATIIINLINYIDKFNLAQNNAIYVNDGSRFTSLLNITAYDEDYSIMNMPVYAVDFMPNTMTPYKTNNGGKTANLPLSYYTSKESPFSKYFDPTAVMKYLFENAKNSSLWGTGPGDRDHKGMIDIDLLDW